MSLASSGITTAAVGNALGTTSRDVGTLCTSSLVNRWSLWKPINLNKQTGITLADIKANRCGLSPIALSYLKTSMYRYTGTKSVQTLATIKSQISQWTWNKPTGGSTSPYRLGDFRNYDADAIPCDSGWGGVTIKDTILSGNQNKGITDTDGSNAQYDWTVNESVYYFNNFAFSIDGTSSGYINAANSHMMPLTYVVGDGSITGEYWRIGVAVYIPYDTAGTSLGQWELFVSRGTMSSSKTAAYLLPDMSTNIAALREIYYCYNNKSVKSFTCIPVLVKNARVSYTAYNSTTMISHIPIESDTMIYAIPSGMQSFTLDVTATSTMPDIEGISEKAASGTFVLGTVAVGTTTNSPYYYPIQSIVVASTSAITAAKTCVLNFTYTTMSNGTQTTTTYNKTISIAKGATVTINGTTYYGTTLVTGPAASIASVTTFTVS